MDFCENAKAWLDANEENVVSLHCKAGKGRAGIMAACLMVRMGQTAQAAVASYDAVRRIEGAFFSFSRALAVRPQVHMIVGDVVGREGGERFPLDHAWYRSPSMPTLSGRRATTYGSHEIYSTSCNHCFHSAVLCQMFVSWIGSRVVKCCTFRRRRVNTSQAPRVTNFVFRAHAKLSIAPQTQCTVVLGLS